jgi:DNA primase
MDVKEQIKRNISITDVVSLYVDLKPSGKYLKALCPFHTEKTPSFMVMPEKDSFACYGCNTFGDIFTFVQEMEKLSFREAMNFLVDKFNIPIDRQKNRQFFKKDAYVQINEIALEYFQHNLKQDNSPEGHNARAYLEKRGIRSDTIDLFALGYAQNRWDGLYNHLRQKSCDIARAIELGLLAKSSNNRIYDKLRGRIIFPILSESGTPVAFGGRTIFDEPNKYLNSPDTPLYKKSSHLYGFHLAKKAIREKKYSVLVEGYFDVVSLYQNGVQNVAASLGTALTDSQIYLLKRFSDNIHIFYDSDQAGIDAAVRGIEKMFELNINPRIILLHGDKDPDDFIREKGPEAFEQLAKNAVDGFRFLVGVISRKYDLNIPEKKHQAIRAVMDFVEKFSEPIVRNEYIRMVADFFQVDEALLKLNDRDRKQRRSTDNVQAKRLVITPAERIFLESILAMPQLIGEVKDLFNNGIYSILQAKNIIRLLLEHYNPETKTVEDYREISAQLSDAERGEFRDIFERAETLPKDREKLERQIETSYLEFTDMLNKRRFQKIAQEIKMAEQANDIDLVQRLIQEKTKYVKSKYKQSIGGTLEQN